MRAVDLAYRLSMPEGNLLGRDSADLLCDTSLAMSEVSLSTLAKERSSQL